VNLFWEVQVDGATGRLLQTSYRWSDLIEKIQDGSILDMYFETNSSILKLIYAGIIGTSLLTFCITGFWLWAGPRLMRNLKDARP